MGAYSVIGEHVTLGKNNRVSSHVVIDGHTTLGDGNQVFPFASVGGIPQDLKFKGEASLLLIGSKNIIREYVTLQPGTATGSMKTVIGDRNLFMACSHVGHDGVIGDENIFANSAALAGHVTVGNRVTVGGLSGIHQFVHLGDLCILGGGSMVSKDIPPFCMAQGDRAGLVGLNRIGLERKGFSKEDIARLKEVYRTLYHGKGSFQQRLQALWDETANFPHGRTFLGFIKNSARGAAGLRSRGRGAAEEE